MAWEGTEVWGVSPESALWGGFLEGLEELFQKVPGETEGEPSVWGEGQGTDTPGALGQQRTSEGLCGLSAWGPFLLRVQPGECEQVSTGHSTAACASLPFPCPWHSWQHEGDKDFPVPPALQQGSLCWGIAEQRGFGLMQGLFKFGQFSFCDLKLVFTGFLSCFVCATSSVQVFCLNQVHVGRMIGSCQFDFSPGTLQKSTLLPWPSPFLGNDHTSLGLLVCSYLPHPAVLGVPAAKIWLGQLLAKLSLVHLITGRVCMGWDYAFSCHKRAFCLKRLRAWSIKTILNPAISSTMLSCVGLYQLQCHRCSLTDTVQNQLLTELQGTLFSQLMVSPFLTCTCAKSHWAVLDTMFLLTVGPGLSLSYGMITSDSFSFSCWVQMLHRNLIYTKSTLECTY